MQWECGKCTFLNEHGGRKCKMCHSPKTEVLGAHGGGKDAFPEDNTTDWQCPQCTLINKSQQRRCSACLFGIRIGNDHVRSWQNDGVNEFDVENEIRIVLIGRTGSGKSATGNSLLGTESFQSLVSASSVTSKCKRGEQLLEGKKVVVVDTPGLFDTGMTNEKVTKEIVKCIGMTSPGPHAMVLVVGIGRFTKEEQDTVQHFVDHFGEGLLQYMIILFTRKDELSKRNQSIQQYVENVPNELKELLQQCGDRYIAFNNDARGQGMKSQVQEFYGMVNKMVYDNGGSCYTSELYQEAEATMQRRMRQQKQKLEMEKKREKVEVERKIQGKYEHKLTQEILQKSQLEEELNRKKNEQKKTIEEKEDLEKNIRNLQQKLKDESQLKSGQDREERKKMETQIEKLKDKLTQVERRNIEKETKRLEKRHKEAERRQEKQIEEMKKEIQELSKLKDREYDQKMTSEKLRKNERDDVETEKNGILDDLSGGFKKIASGAVKAGKKFLSFLGF